MPAIFLLLAACGGGSSGGDGSSASGNSVPVANAGLDQNITVGVPVELDGSASSDADGDALTYSWALTSKPNGSSALLASPTSESPTFVPDLAGSYALSLTVNDGKRDSATSSLTLEAVSSNSAPVANAGRGQNVLVGATVELDGSTSSDADGDALTYSWALISKPSGSSAALASPTSVSPTFVADLSGSYVTSLIVNDGNLNSVASTVTVEAATDNAAPIAGTGPDRSVIIGTTVELDGSASSDADGDALTYSWALTSKPNGSSALLSSPTSVSPTFVPDLTGSYVASLTVNDGKEESLAAIVELTASFNDTSGPRGIVEARG